MKALFLKKWAFLSLNARFLVNYCKFIKKIWLHAFKIKGLQPI